MKTYDLLVILDLAGKEESLPETLALVENEVKSIGGKVRRIQKMERKKFEYVAGPLEAGFYVNITCDLPPQEIPKLRGKLELCSPVYRHLLVTAGEEGKSPKSKVAAETAA
jgi:small subunit ribosomal protein S6